MLECLQERRFHVFNERPKKYTWAACISTLARFKEFLASLRIFSMRNMVRRSSLRLPSFYHLTIDDGGLGTSRVEKIYEWNQGLDPRGSPRHNIVCAHACSQHSIYLLPQAIHGRGRRWVGSTTQTSSDPLQAIEWGWMPNTHDIRAFATSHLLLCTWLMFGDRAQLSTTSLRTLGYGLAHKATRGCLALLAPISEQCPLGRWTRTLAPKPYPT